MAQRKTCLQRLRELEKEFNWEGEEKTDYSSLPTFHVTYTKKEKKQIRKENKSLKKKIKKSTKTQYYRLLGTFDPWTQDDIIRHFRDDFKSAIDYMRGLSERVQSEYSDIVEITPEEYCLDCDARATAGIDPIVSSGNWEAWEKYVDDHPNMELTKLHKKRKKFLKIIKKFDSKLRKKYKAFETYDPLFRMRKIDEVELKKSLKMLTRENKERRDRFLEYMQKSFGLEKDPYLMRSFKERTDAANKALNRYILDMNKAASYKEPELDDYGEPMQPPRKSESFELDLSVDQNELRRLFGS